MTIKFTKEVAEHINEKLQARGHGLGLRLSINTTGCSGFAYAIDFADSKAEGDVVFTEHGASIYISEKYLRLVDGTQIDYEIQGINKKLVFNNPKAGSLCGCGESFTLADDELE